MTAQTRARVQGCIDRLRGRERAVKFLYDGDGVFEECNGERRPLTEAEYKKYPYRACPKHWRARTKVIRTLKNGRQIQGCATCGNTKYKTIPYAEYLEYYGNPSRHVYLGCITEHRPINCGCDDENCECWDTIGSVWGIDIMDDDPALEIVTIGIRMSLAEARAQLPGWLLECIAEDAEGYV